MEILHFSVGDTLLLKKPHPCGAAAVLVLRLGSSVRVRCAGCGHDMTIPRVKLEKHIKKIISAEEN